MKGGWNIKIETGILTAVEILSVVIQLWNRAHITNKCINFVDFKMICNFRLWDNFHSKNHKNKQFTFLYSISISSLSLQVNWAIS